MNNDYNNNNIPFRDDGNDSGYDSLSESESEGDNFVDDEGYLGDDEDSSDDEANRDVCFRHPENWRVKEDCTSSYRSKIEDLLRSYEQNNGITMPEKQEALFLGFTSYPGLVLFLFLFAMVVLVLAIAMQPM